MARKRLVCRDCHAVIEEGVTELCPRCGSASLTEDWSGYVIVVHPEQSEIAQEMEVTEPGEYALKVR